MARVSREVGAHTFDRRLYSGVSSTRNAIAVLRLMGYPVDVVRLGE
ncbi:MAG: hypothetical protein ABIT38_08350 [Gemmatimonadaceae bacterium]